MALARPVSCSGNFARTWLALFSTKKRDEDLSVLTGWVQLLMQSVSTGRVV